MRSLLIFAIVVSCVFAGAKPMTWKDCTGKDALVVIKDVTLTPNPMVRGQNTTVVGKGLVKKTVEVGATWKMVSSLNRLPVLEKKGDLCSNGVVDLPFHVGAVYVKGVDCPFPAGDITLVEKAYLGSTPPPGDYGVKLTATNPDGTEIVCFQVDIPI